MENDNHLRFETGRAITIETSDGDLLLASGKVTLVAEGFLNIRLGKGALIPGTRVRLTQSGEGGKLVAFASVDAAGTAGMVATKLERNVVLNQMREHFRIDTTIPHTFRPLGGIDETAAMAAWQRETARVQAEKPPLVSDDGTVAWRGLTAITPRPLNLSGGGACIEAAVAAGEHLILYLFLPCGHPRPAIPLLCRVIGPGRPGAVPTVRLKFCGITEHDQDDIVAFVFRQERTHNG